jgi:hypothetical protein
MDQVAFEILSKIKLVAKQGMEVGMASLAGHNSTV